MPPVPTYTNERDRESSGFLAEQTKWGKLKDGVKRQFSPEQTDDESE